MSMNVMKILSSFSIVIFLFTNTSLLAQHLSLKNAVKIGIEENLYLETKAQEIAISKLNTGNGAAGMLPTVTAEGNVNYSISNTKQQFLDGRENAINGGSAFNTGATVRLDWTIFDGKAMFVRRDRLFKEFELASLELKQEAQTLSAAISVTYQNLVLQSAVINILDENAEYLEDLVTLSKAKLDIGSGTKLDVLQAQTDLNELINARELAKMEFEMSTAELNRDLNRDASQSFEVDTTFIKASSLMTYEDWVDKALKSNYALKTSEKSYEIAKQDIELAEAAALPTIDLNSGLDFGYLNSTTGFLTSNQSLGPFIGVTARYNIFDGNRVKRNLQIAELQAKISELAIDRVSLETKNELFILFQRYKYYVAQVELEKENLALAAENFKLANALFENGGITQYELRQVRIQRLAIQRRLVQAEYQMAVAYIGLMELSGESWL